MTVTALTPVPHQQVRGTVQIRADVYPANVVYSFAHNEYSQSRAIVTADEVIVLVDGRDTPNVYYRGRLENVGGTHDMLVATTADGTVTVTRAQGCGCGSRLKSYQPFTRAVRMAAR